MNKQIVITTLTRLISCKHETIKNQRCKLHEDFWKKWKEVGPGAFVLRYDNFDGFFDDNYEKHKSYVSLRELREHGYDGSTWLDDNFDPYESILVIIRVYDIKGLGSIKYIVDVPELYSLHQSL